MKIKCFGIARDITQSDHCVMDNSHIKNVSDLRKELNEKYGQLATIKNYMIAINQEYATDEQVILATDEIAIIPPVSGG